MYRKADPLRVYREYAFEGGKVFLIPKGNKVKQSQGRHHRELKVEVIATM